MQDAIKKTTDDPTDAELYALIGQLLLVGFEGADTDPPPAIADALARGDIGGTILFRRNITSVEQVSALNTRIHQLSENAVAAPFVAVDQEGGRVVRLKDPLTPIPPMRAVGDMADLRLTADVSEVIATEIAALGFNLNFAPVLDVDTNPENPIIGDRAFSNDPAIVTRTAGAFLIGHHIAQVIPCGKHFPGHGDTLVDSHIALPVLEHDRARLDAVELQPFRRMASANIPMLMTAHMMVPCLDPEHPSTLSRATIRGLLRDELGYEGVVITDDLEMAAVAAHYEIEEMVELGLRAGIDIFLICRSEDIWQRARKHLFALARNNFDDLIRVQRAAERVLALKESLLGPKRRPWTPYPGWQKLLGCEEHRETMARIEQQASGPSEDPTELDA
ncbi:beta-N-acetylhexosaminidase [Bradymonas sediminis]|uniref:beta-N-acetylhexosaminidase n=1 Tax=Bradymonas sediminis TaxID=1548548 RepID=UPI0013A6C364|nr:beta-N-acetylhexosaminidase [Bradymonas sediminis]